MATYFREVEDGVEIEDPDWGGWTLSFAEARRLHSILNRLEKEGKLEPKHRGDGKL